MLVLLGLAIISLLMTAVCTLEVALGMRRIAILDSVSPIKRDNVPKVSVIIPACNEATTIEPALTSILSLDYVDIEVIAINDRSADQTLGVLKQIQKKTLP